MNDFINQNPRRLAVMLIDTQNSGKTTTIKYFDTHYDEWGRTKKHTKNGWRHLKLHNNVLESLITWIYFIPASPTETNKSLVTKLGDQRPEMLLVAEQIDRGEGNNRYQETLDFLSAERYDILEIVLGDEAVQTLWQKWNSEEFDTIMRSRAVEIGNHFLRMIA